jgi:hypothetical protein
LGSTDTVIPCPSQTAEGILVIDADKIDFGSTIREFPEIFNFGIG